MSRRCLLVAFLATFLLGIACGGVQAAPGDGCKTRACKAHVRAEIRADWRATVKPHRDWLRRLRACEAGGSYFAVSAGGLYRGAGQFDRGTWQSVGGRGHVAGLWGTRWAEPLEQDVRTVRLRKSRGMGPWPVCRRGIG